MALIGVFHIRRYSHLIKQLLSDITVDKYETRVWTSCENLAEKTQRLHQTLQVQNSPPCLKRTRKAVTGRLAWLRQPFHPAHF